MTDNLRFKVDQILEYMQNEYLSLSFKLDQIITLLGGVPPTPSATLDSVVEAIQGTNQLLLGIQTDTTSSDQRLARLEAGLTLPIGSGIPSVQTNVNTAIGHLNTIISLLNGQPLDDQLAALQSLETYLSAIRTAIGIPTGDATTTALGYLSSIAYSNAQIADCTCEIGSEPETDTCTNPYLSSNVTLRIQSSNGVGVLWNTAQFPDPAPEGTHFETLGEETIPRTILIPDAFWDGWRVYVQSGANVYSEDENGNAFYPTNVWRELDGGYPKIFSVFLPHTLTVTLCPVEPEPTTYGGESWEEWPNTQQCIVISSSLIHIEPRNETKSTSYAILPPNGVVIQNSINFDDPWPAYSMQEYAIWAVDLYGFTISLVTGNHAGIGYNRPGGGSGGGSLTPGSSYTFTEHTSEVIIVDYWGASEPAPSEFTVEMCRPELL